MASELRANTDIMRDGANSIASGGETIGQATSKINAVGNDMGSPYGGQLTEKLIPILSNIRGEGDRLHIESQTISETLSNQARDIDTVMQSQDVSSIEISQNDLAPSPLRAFFSNIREYGVIATFLSIFGIERKPSDNLTKYTTHIPENMTVKTAEAPPNSSLKLESKSPQAPVNYDYVVTAGFPAYGDTKTLHPGIDIAPPRSATTPIAITPIGAGKVFEVVESDTGYGNHIIVEHHLSNGDTVYSLYGHLAQKPNLEVGDNVFTNTTMGYMGHTGNVRSSTGDGTHLHLEIRKKPSLSSDIWGKLPNDKVPSDNPAINMTWKQKMLSQVYSPQDVLNGTGNAQDWKFITPE